MDGVLVEEETAPVPVKVAMLMVVFLGRALPVPALIVPIVPGATGTVVEAVPFAEMVLLVYALAEWEAEEAEADFTAEAFAPCTVKGPK